MDKSAASQEPVSLSTPGLTLASPRSLPAHLLVSEMVRAATEVLHVCHQRAVRNAECIKVAQINLSDHN